MSFMAWLPKLGSNGEKILHLKLKDHEPWKPYTAFPQHAISDYKIAGGSKGWATFQKLLKEGWKLVSTKEAYTNSR